MNQQSSSEASASAPSPFRCIPLSEAGDNDCRWTIGEPKDGICCGNPVSKRGKSYCAVHSSGLTRVDNRWQANAKPDGQYSVKSNRDKKRTYRIPR